MNGTRTANDGEIVRKWAVAGKGLAVKSSLDVCDDILAKRLIVLLPQVTVKPTQLWLICPSRQAITPSVRLLREMLTTRCNDLLSKLANTGALDRHQL